MEFALWFALVCFFVAVMVFIITVNHQAPLVPAGPWVEAARCVKCNTGIAYAHKNWRPAAEGESSQICQTCGSTKFLKGIGRPIKGHTAWEWADRPFVAYRVGTKPAPETKPKEEKTEAARIAAELETDKELTAQVEQLLKRKLQ